MVKFFFYDKLRTVLSFLNLNYYFFSIQEDSKKNRSVTDAKAEETISKKLNDLSFQTKNINAKFEKLENLIKNT